MKLNFKTREKLKWKLPNDEYILVVMVVVCTIVYLEWFSIFFSFSDFFSTFSSAELAFWFPTLPLSLCLGLYVGFLPLYVFPHEKECRKYANVFGLLDGFFTFRLHMGNILGQVCGQFRDVPCGHTMNARIRKVHLQGQLTLVDLRKGSDFFCIRTAKGFRKADKLRVIFGTWRDGTVRPIVLVGNLLIQELLDAWHFCVAPQGKICLGKGYRNTELCTYCDHALRQGLGNFFRIARFVQHARTLRFVDIGRSNKGKSQDDDR